MKASLFDRAYGCLVGVAVGDAIGMAVELVPRDEVVRQYDTIEGLVDPISPITKDLGRGHITDDTELTLLVAETLISEGRVTAEALAKRLVKWARSGALNLPYVGPSTKRALEKLLNGAPPSEAGAEGVTCGAAVRVSPVGIVNVGNIENAVKEAVEASIPTHNTRVAASAAAAVAAAIAEAISGSATVDTVLEAALQGAELGASLVPCGGRAITAKIELALRVATSLPVRKAAVSVVERLGKGVRADEVVPAALAIFAAARGDPREAILAAANAGGDTDSIASIAGAIAGALRGFSAIPIGWLEEVERVNALNLREVAAGLVKVALTRLRGMKSFNPGCTLQRF